MIFLWILLKNSLVWSPSAISERAHASARISAAFRTASRIHRKNSRAGVFQRHPWVSDSCRASQTYPASRRSWHSPKKMAITGRVRRVSCSPSIPAVPLLAHRSPGARAWGARTALRYPSVRQLAKRHASGNRIAHRKLRGLVLHDAVPAVAVMAKHDDADPSAAAVRPLIPDAIEWR